MNMERPKRSYTKDKSSSFGIRLPMPTFSSLEAYVSDNNTWRAVVINNALAEYFSSRGIDVSPLKSKQL
jgi:hypothetical protein